MCVSNSRFVTVVKNKHPLHTQGRQTVLPMHMCWEHQMDSRVCSQATDVGEDPVQIALRFQHAVIFFCEFPAYLGLACKLG